MLRATLSAPWLFSFFSSCFLPHLPCSSAPLLDIDGMESDSTPVSAGSSLPEEPVWASGRDGTEKVVDEGEDVERMLTGEAFLNLREHLRVIMRWKS